MLVKFEQNCMVRTIQNIELFDKKWLTICVDAILEDFFFDLNDCLMPLSY